MKKCSKDKKFFEREYIKFRKSANKIAKEFGFTEITVYRRLKKFGLIRSISEANKGKYNGQWKGNKVGYCSLHEWIGNRKLKPEFCEECKKVKPYDLANISGRYKRDINDFEWLCRSCHMKKDFKSGMRKIKGVKNQNLPNLQ